MQRGRAAGSQEGQGSKSQLCCEVTAAKGLYLSVSLLPHVNMRKGDCVDNFVVKQLPCKSENLSLSAQNPCKDGLLTGTSVPMARWEIQTESAEAPKPTSLAHGAAKSSNKK